MIVGDMKQHKCQGSRKTMKIQNFYDLYINFVNGPERVKDNNKFEW